MAARTTTYSMRRIPGKNAAYRTNASSHEPIHSKGRTNVASHEPINSKARFNWFIFGSWSVMLVMCLAFWAGVISLFM